MPATLPEPLTLRQVEFLVHAANGCTYQEIADIEGVAVDTVKHTLAAARARAGARNLPNLVAIAVSSGLIQYWDELPDPE